MKRILDLAKELGVDAAEVQRVAVECNVVVSGPTSSLDTDDQNKIRNAVKADAKAEPKSTGGKTLTLNRPMVAGQTRSGGQVEGRGRTVEVAVRRRHAAAPKPAAKPAPVAAKTPAAAPVEKTPEVIAPVTKQKLTPAQRAAASVEKKKQDAANLARDNAAAKQAEAKAIAEKTAAAKAAEVKPAEPAKVKPAAAKPAVTKPVAAKAPVAKPTMTLKPKPADIARKAVAPSSVRPSGGGVQGANRPVAERQAANRPGANRPAGARPAGANQTTNAPGNNRPSVNRPANGPAGNRPNQARPGANQARPGAGSRPNQGRPGAARPTAGAQPTHKGPRTTIRRGLTPAQIAASKAPRSSVKQIEKKISEERAAQRRNTSRPARPGGTQNQGAGAPRRSPSVAVAPGAAGAGAPPPPGAGQRRRGPGGARPIRRLSPAEKAARRAYSSKRHEVLSPEQEERQARLARGAGSKRFSGTVTKDDEDFVVRTVGFTDPILVSELASRMAFKSSEVVKKLFEMGIMTTVNESIDGDTATLIIEEFGHKAKLINAAAVEDVLVEDVSEDDEGDLEPRPPVVVVMGHVDHGKTSILDALRKAKVADGEAGGITQHIGAYMVKLEGGERVVFVDTPGHEAFTGLRARGASMTDVAVLVVAADDGVMPQTVEALNHARAAGVPIIVAVNKMDKDGANPDMVKRQLAEHDVTPEDWGGDTIFVEVSAHTGQGLDDLLEMLALQTEILELRANPTRRGKGIVVESRLDKGRGPVATVLVQNGTFKQGDTVVVGSATGRLRAIVDENSVQHRTAGPSIPFELLGLDSVPEAGQEIYAVENEKQARDIVRYRKDRERELGADAKKRASLDELFANMQSGVKEVPVLIKGDVTGSVEAMAESLTKAGTDEVKVKIIHKAIGGITESDVMLASAANAIIIGFNVRPENKAKKVAEVEGVDIRFYKVIYDAIDEVKAAMAGVLSPNKVEKVTGTADVREVFQAPKVGAVAGCYMTDGYVTRGAHVRVLRENVLIYDGVLASLRRFKDDVKEVKSGYEFGTSVEKFNDVKEGDTFEFFIIEEVAATL
ncbi:translation initiation factor IF-2 [Mariprofundus sp. EBB-1]|uniref:translation initiation factor IF-2 n=1 Tax=Mariprofundus sp. EBB-1 TaxID=2650971 RepID=UPI000EF1B4A1|nr:translation initiation factor IF-2 [Mariprofundus sp. EBB-1]RLL55538.1 translation initiation factor IF-2 [Mariprofundus sp. EBB-1]